ncbi:MAG TPA: ABC-type transport auxiliary lipoprotein family protein [Candidatus Kapabacteria bacterium]|nr:ABC-type transport auxiliary lipoprotein family protein [Candidatus Kapabacteria bacterium]HPO63103.1 ABC-type transport auxiliary lipoprotein family protein [Candidatus Kapabacteria bacterium]
MKSLYKYCLLFVCLTGCISIKSDYPATEYYRLEQEQTKYRNIGTIPNALLVRDFTLSEEIDTDRLIAVVDNTSVKRYFYHRWITDCSSLITDFIVKRYNEMNTFANGVVKSTSIIMADYILEGHILDMVAHNSDVNKEVKNDISLSIRITLLGKIPNSTENEVLLSKVYSRKETRLNNLATTIAPAFSKAFSLLADEILGDIQVAIARKEYYKEEK